MKQRQHGGPVLQGKTPERYPLRTMLSVEPTHKRGGLGLKPKRNSPLPDLAQRIWLCVDLPTMEYKEAWDLQAKIVAARKDRIIETNIILFLEHPPVFTLGRRGGLNNLTVSEAFLEKEGIPIIQVERGGDITFHGPGQLVIYPIIDLRAARLGVVDYVTALEEVMIRTAADWGIKAERNPRNRGVWVRNNKLGSIGVAIRRGVSFHGLALNVNTSLKPFSWIHPCGLEDTEITSLERELSHTISLSQVREATRHHMEAVFGVKLAIKSLAELKRLF
jgi:lipoate-protein ligase B